MRGLFQRIRHAASAPQPLREHCKLSGPAGGAADPCGDSDLSRSDSTAVVLLRALGQAPRTAPRQAQAAPRRREVSSSTVAEEAGFPLGATLLPEPDVAVCGLSLRCLSVVAVTGDGLTRQHGVK